MLDLVLYRIEVGPTPFNAVDALDGHQEGPVDVPNRVRDVTIQGDHQFVDATALVLGISQGGPGVATHAGDVFAVEPVLREQVTNLKLDQFDQFLVVHQVALVEEHDDVGGTILL